MSIVQVWVRALIALQERNLLLIFIHLPTTLGSSGPRHQVVYVLHEKHEGDHSWHPNHPPQPLNDKVLNLALDILENVKQAKNDGW